MIYAGTYAGTYAYIYNSWTCVLAYIQA